MSSFSQNPSHIPYSALDALQALEANDITLEAIFQHFVSEIKSKEEKVGAFEWLNLDDTLTTIQSWGQKKTKHPLQGLPFAVKDIIETANIPTTYGSPIWQNYKPQSDATIIALAKRAGGYMLGKTVTAEFAFLHPGKTRNPHNLNYTPGGSSSGSAAAVAAGMVPFAIGTQTGGSIIRPAAFCGITGFKPSFRLIPTVGVKTFSWTLDTVGFFARTINDIAYFAAVISERDLRVDHRPCILPRIGICHTHLWGQASNAMQNAIEQTARLCEQAGAHIIDITLDRPLQDAHDAHQTIQDYEAVRALAWEYNTHPNQLSDSLCSALDNGIIIDAQTYDYARRTANQARKRIKDLFTEHAIDIILTPAAPGIAPRGLTSTGSSIFNRLWTLLGTPCLNIPGMNDATGLPLGIQIIAPFGHDFEILMAGRAIEAIIRSK